MLQHLVGGKYKRRTCLLWQSLSLFLQNSVLLSIRCCAVRGGPNADPGTQGALLLRCPCMWPL